MNRGVVEDGRLGGHRLAGRVGEPVGGPHHKGAEGQLVAVLGGLLLLGGGVLLGHAEGEADLGAEHVLEGLSQQVAVAAQQRLLVEIVGRLDNGHALPKIQGDGLQAAEPRFISHVRNLGLAVITDKFPCLIE